MALFATNARYKREAFRGSEYAPKILDQYGIKVVMKASASLYLVEQNTYSAHRATVHGFVDYLLSTIISHYIDPVQNSRYLLYEAQQAHYYGLPDNVALASVTSSPAEVMGLDHRIDLSRKVMMQVRLVCVLLVAILICYRPCPLGFSSSRSWRDTKTGIH